MKTYERKLLNQLLQGQELIIKRNGYRYTFKYDKKKRFLNKDNGDGCNYTVLIPYGTVEEIGEEIKGFMNRRYTISMLYDEWHNWFLQKNGSWVDDDCCLEIDKYYKKPDVDYIVEKAKAKLVEYMKENNIKLDRRKTINCSFGGHYINIVKLL